MTSTLYRYLGYSIFKGWIIVLTVLMAIFSLIAFVDELERVGGLYQVADAVRYIAGTLPQRAVDLSPVIALLGSLIALAGLARHSEIIAMRAAGTSPRHFLGAVAVPAVALTLCLMLFSEYVSAPAHHYAEELRNVKRTGKGSLLKGKGLWMNDGLSYFNVRRLQHGAIPADISIYEFDQQGMLTEYVHADTADTGEDRTWLLQNVTRKSFDGKATHTRHLPDVELGPFWSPDELPVVRMTTAAMPLVDMYHYIDYLKSRGQDTRQLELSLWQKITLPLSAGTMVFLAIPIGTSLSSQRNADFAKRLGIGTVIGIAVYLLTQIIHTLGLLIGAPPLLTALLPLLLILLATIVLLRKMTG